MIEDAVILQKMQRFGTFLPKCLSEKSASDLLQDLVKFPEGFDSRVFSFTGEADCGVLYQGDGLSNFDFVFLPDTIKIQGKGIILSNTCDLDLDNNKATQRVIVYAPIFNLKKWQERLSNEKGPIFAEQFVRKIRRQEIAQLFYLPHSTKTKEEAFVDLAQINHCARETVTENQIKEDRLFSLNNTGFYVLLFKISVFYCRLQEGIDRG